MSTSLIDELKYIHEFLSAQSTIVDADVLQQVMCGQARTLEDRIRSSSSMDHQLATQLTQFIAQGPWLPAHKQQLVAALNDRLTQQTSSGTGRRRPNQTLLNFQAYMTAPLIDLLSSPASDMAKLNGIVELCSKLGMDCPSEKTTQHIVSVFVAIAHKCAPDPKLAFGYVADFKRLLKARCVPSQRHHITTYPENPRDLPAAIYDVVYPSGVEPIDSGVSMSDLRVVASSVACRRTSKLVRSSSSTDVRMDHTSLMHQLAPLLSQCIQNSNPRRQVGGINLQFLQPRGLPSSPHTSGSPGAEMVACPSPISDVHAPMPAIADVPAAAPVVPAGPPLFSTPKSPHEAANIVMNALNNRPKEDDVSPHGKPDGTQSVPKGASAKKVASKSNAASKSKTTPKPKGSVTKATNVSKTKVSTKGGTSKHNAKCAAKTKPAIIPVDILKKYKDGCSRCRFSKGCTPSCWRLRGYTKV